MTSARRFLISATAALLLAAGAGCANNGESPDAAEPTAEVSPTATASASTTRPTSPTEGASAQSEALIRDYYALRDELRQDPEVPLSELDAVATSVELSAQKRLLENERAQGQTQEGDTAIADLKVESVNLDNSDPDAGKVPTVLVDVCWDVRDVDIVDRSGKSVVSPDRPDAGWIRYTVANYHWDKDPEGGWRVATSRDLEKTPCELS
ncbi:hypothetical protein FXB39_07945 [Nocardioides sp. BGMRC 2183]|nr:hypothetical protein FXB39_07945 [Nocardioides sp. BGMRC 2183]